MKFKDFYSSLSFLEQYGFKYYPATRFEGHCFKNKYGKIVNGSKQLDTNYWVDEFYTDINGWKNIIKVDEEYNKISNKKNKNNYYMLHEIVNHQLNTNYKLFDIRLDLEYIEKLQGIIKYEYFFQKEYLIDKLKNYKYKRNDDYLIQINDNKISIGIERAGHIGGYFYVADIYEENNKTKIEGKIILNPDENGNPIVNNEEYSKLKIFRDTFIILLLFWWLLLIFLLIATISKLFDKTKNKKELTKEQKLDNFMINYLLCEKI